MMYLITLLNLGISRNIKTIINKNINTRELSILYTLDLLFTRTSYSESVRYKIYEFATKLEIKYEGSKIINVFTSGTSI